MNARILSFGPFEAVMDPDTDRALNIEIAELADRHAPVVCRKSSQRNARHLRGLSSFVARPVGYDVAAMGTEAVRFLVVWMAGWIHSRQLEVIDFLREENRILREQLGGRRLRFNDDQRRRLAAKGRIVGRRRLGEFAGLVTPDTILRWYRELIAHKYDGSARRRTGRPTVAVDVEQLVVQMATENPTWGYTRLVGALDNLGHQVGRNTVKRVLLRHGLEPAPARGRRMPWKTFLRTHLGAIAAADFFSCASWYRSGRTTYDERCRSTSNMTIANATTKAWATGCLRPPNLCCDQPTGTRRSSAANGWAGCSTSTTGAPHESAIHF